MTDRTKKGEVDDHGPFPESAFPKTSFPRNIFPWMGEDDEDVSEDGEQSESVVDKNFTDDD